MIVHPHRVEPESLGLGGHPQAPVDARILLESAEIPCDHPELHRGPILPRAACQDDPEADGRLHLPPAPAAGTSVYLVCRLINVHISSIAVTASGGSAPLLYHSTPSSG